MVNGVHSILYTREAEKVRTFFRDVLNFNAIDAGGGWLIFALPPGEFGVHPAEEDEFRFEMYLMCDDVKRTVAELAAKGVKCSEVRDQGWGLVTSIALPGGGKMGLYEPRHVRAATA